MAWCEVATDASFVSPPIACTANTCGYCKGFLCYAGYAYRRCYGRYLRFRLVQKRKSRFLRNVCLLELRLRWQNHQNIRVEYHKVELYLACSNLRIIATILVPCSCESNAKQAVCFCDHLSKYSLRSQGHRTLSDLMLYGTSCGPGNMKTCYRGVTLAAGSNVSNALC